MTKNNVIVPIYESHAEAEAAVKELRRSGFDMKELSIVGRERRSWLSPQNAWALQEQFTAKRARSAQPASSEAFPLKPKDLQTARFVRYRK